MSRCFYLKTHARLIARLRAARISRSPRKVKTAVRTYFASKGAAYEMTRRVLGSRATAARISTVAEAVEPYSPCAHRVRWWQVPKRSSGYRIVCSLPLVQTVRHRMIKEVLSVLFTPNEHIFDVKRRGRDRLARSVAAAMEEGFTHAYVADVRNCFPSVNPDTFGQLPLPTQVIRYALDYRNLNFRHDHVKERVVSPSLYNGLGNPWPRRDGPSGMLQGSPTANLILAWLFNDLSEHMSEGCRPFLQSDDLIVLAPSASACSRIEEAVTRYFGGHQAGPFVLEGNIVSVHDAFEKLGYRFHKSELFGRVTVDMSDFNARRVLRRVLAKVEEDIANGNRRPVRAQQALLNTMSGFSAVTYRSAVIEMYMEIIEYEFLANA